MAYRLPPLNALRAFEAAARHLSFSKAAERLKLALGKAAIVMIKSSAVVLVTDFGGYALSARNQFAGTLSRVERGAVSSLVVLTLPGGMHLTAEDGRPTAGCAVKVSLLAPPPFAGAIRPTAPSLERTWVNATQTMATVCKHFGMRPEPGR